MANTLEEIALLSGVSRSTVSRVVNGSPGVNPDTRAHVLDVIRQEGYRPNLSARSLASGRTNVLGVVIPIGAETLVEDPYFAALLNGIARAADLHSRFVMLSLAQSDFLHRIDEVARQGIVDGVIISATQADDPFVTQLLESGATFVSVGRHDDERVSYVDIDNVASARQATAHLLRLGRRRVATISGPSYATPAIDRLQGYRDALENRGLSFEQALVQEADFTEAGGRAAMRELLPHRPDAVFAMSDRMAVGALNELQSAGLRVPEDVAVVGFDDIPRARTTQPPLTTVRQDPRRIGATAVDLLLDLIDDPGAFGRRVVLPVEMVIRASCGAHLSQERKTIDATT